MLKELSVVYGMERAALLYRTIQQKIADFKTQRKLSRREWMSEQDVILITYGDQITQPGSSPLKTLHRFLREYLNNGISSIHILPFYPYSSDDGFSVINYRAVNPRLGDWSDIELFSRDFRLMFDAVINHVSSKSEWFQGYLSNDPRYRNYFIEAQLDLDYSRVTRPRALSLFTSFQTTSGEKHVWTTFSADQIDLNYDNEDLLLEIIDLLLYYVAHGAQIIRLDAIGYLWKQDGTNCIHLPQTHAIVKVFRAVLDVAAPGTILITETNVPHQDNISYFGNGYDEAQMVYQFPLPPLTLHAFYSGSSRYLSQWAKTLETPTKETTFFNFMASHDGIGVTPALGILPLPELDMLVEEVQRRDGQVSYKNNGDGTKSPYELNITWYSALTEPREDPGLSIKRFMASQAILLALQGVPGIYIHSLFGSRNDQVGMTQTRQSRSINRRKFTLNEVEGWLQDTTSIEGQIFKQYLNLLSIRKLESSFHPNARQSIVEIDESLFCFVRGSVFCVNNISNNYANVHIALQELGFSGTGYCLDLISGQSIPLKDDALEFLVEPYQVLWIKEQANRN